MSGLSTKNLTSDSVKKVPDDFSTLSTRDRKKKLQEFHLALFKKEGATNPKFIPRLCYKHNDEMVISFYPKEMYGGKDIYVEFCSRDFIPEDPERKLWKWYFNPEYEMEYEKSDPHPATGDRRAIIPIDELICVNEIHNPKPEVKEEEEIFIPETEGADTDCPYNDMTLRDYVAIQWKKPVSHKKWLNELITKNFK